MVDQTQQTLLNMDLRPAYYDDFHCLMAGCRYSCCKGGWKVTFDKRDYLKLKRLEGSPEFKERLAGAVRRIRNDSNTRDYGEFDMSAGTCPLLREDCLCGLQVEKGAEVLPKICRVFPRTEIYSSGYLERSLSPACEGVLELLWNLPDGVEFRSDILPQKKWKETRLKDDEFLTRYFPVIREWCVDALQDRRHSLPDRLMLMGMGLRQLAEGEQDIPLWLHRVRNMMESTEPILPQEPEYHVLQEFLSNNIGILMQIAVKATEFSSIRSDIIQGLGATLTLDGWDIKAKVPIVHYQEAAKRYEERFSDRKYFMENLMVALLFHLILPNPTSTDALWKSYVNLCNLYSFYRFLAVLSCREGAPGDKDELFRMFVFASRALVHNSTRQNKLRDDFFQNDSSTLAHMAILLCG